MVSRKTLLKKICNALFWDDENYEEPMPICVNDHDFLQKLLLPIYKEIERERVHQTAKS